MARYGRFDYRIVDEAGKLLMPLPAVTTREATKAWRRYRKENPRRIAQLRRSLAEERSR